MISIESVDPVILPVTNSFTYLANGQIVSAVATGYATEHVIRFPPGSCLIGHHVFTPDDLRAGALAHLGLAFRPMSDQSTVWVLCIEHEP